MAFSRILSASFSALVIFILGACNNSDKTAQTNTDTTAANSTTTTTTTPASTTVTTPQNMMVVMHKVANYSKWKTSYDSHDSVRLAFGIHSYVVGRGVQDSNMLLVAVKIDDTARAAAFGKDPSLKQAMKNGGVIGAPKMEMITMTFQDTSTLPANIIRSSSTFTVKDWDAWETNFKSGSQERTDNGLALRAYGHYTNDNHKVRVVTALLDSAKAVAYFKSDLLKKRIQASGVTSPIDRFLYKIAQKY